MFRYHNLSGITLLRSIIEATKRHQVKPDKLELEITENILMDEPQVVVDALG